MASAQANGPPLHEGGPRGGSPRAAGCRRCAGPRFP